MWIKDEHYRAFEDDAGSIAIIHAVSRSRRVLARITFDGSSIEFSPGMDNREARALAQALREVSADPAAKLWPLYSGPKALEWKIKPGPDGLLLRDIKRRLRRSPKG